MKTNWSSKNHRWNIYEEYEEAVGSSILSDELKNKMTKDDFMRHLKSATLTFVSMFLLTVSVGVLSDGFTWTKASLLALGVSAVIAGVRGIAKLIVEWWGVKT